MFAAVGLVVLMLMVFGGFAITGGNLGPVSCTRFPHEMLIIGGAALGSHDRIGNSMRRPEAARRRTREDVQGAAIQEAGLSRRIFLVSTLMKMMRTDGPVALESPHRGPESPPSVFTQYPSCSRTIRSSTSSATRCASSSSPPARSIRMRSRR
jgi:chemotaxis protein MotA